MSDRVVHEWNQVYQNTSPPPWDIGQPQPVFRKLVETGEMSPPALLVDLGCGTGENAIFYAQNGFTTYAVDLAQSAIAKAVVKAKQRRAKVDFRASNALSLEFDDEMFDYATDSGLFHIFDDANRKRFVKEVARILKPGGTYYMMCFSEKEPTDWGGPRRVSKKEILEALGPLFTVNYVRDELFTTRIHGDKGGKSYLTSASRRSD